VKGEIDQHDEALLPLHANDPRTYATLFVCCFCSRQQNASCVL